MSDWMLHCCFQGYLYKKSTKPLNKEWKKKYVALSDDGKIIYHPSLHVSTRTSVTSSILNWQGDRWRSPQKKLNFAWRISGKLLMHFIQQPFN